MQKSGIVFLVGRPNVGKSTLLNNLLNRKVAITSPKPQTTRFALQAVYEDERGQIIFVDTPGILAKAEDQLAQNINRETEKTLGGDVDVIVYLLDHTRARDQEENRTLGQIRKMTAPKILVINKVDKSRPDFSADYAFYKDEFDIILKISALKRQNLNLLLDEIFKLLPKRPALISTADLVQPALNLDSKLFISEIIREKVFLSMREEVPYTVQVVVDEIEERNLELLYIKAHINTTADRYKVMLIGKKGVMIREIGILARKELETASGKKVYVDLTVEVNPHWMTMA